MLSTVFTNLWGCDRASDWRLFGQEKEYIFMGWYNMLGHCWEVLWVIWLSYIYSLQSPPFCESGCYLTQAGFKFAMYPGLNLNSLSCSFTFLSGRWHACGMSVWLDTALIFLNFLLWQGLKKLLRLGLNWLSFFLNLKNNLNYMINLSGPA